MQKLFNNIGNLKIMIHTMYNVTLYLNKTMVTKKLQQHRCLTKSQWRRCTVVTYTAVKQYNVRKTTNRKEKTT